MALFKSNLLAQASGSLNGTTFSRNKGGAYIRGRGIPSNPQTDRQDQVRTAMAVISKAWKNTLTQNQRDQWNAYGANLQVINRLGDTTQLSGIAAFNSLNLFRMGSLTEPMLLDPPAAAADPAAAPPFDSATLNYDAPDTLADIEVGSPTSGFSMLVYYSAPLSPGIKYFRGPYLGRVEIAGSGGGSTAFSGALPKYSTSTVGAAIAMKLVLFNATTKQPVWTVHVDPVIVTSL